MNYPPVYLVTQHIFDNFMSAGKFYGNKFIESTRIQEAIIRMAVYSPYRSFKQCFFFTLELFIYLQFISFLIIFLFISVLVYVSFPIDVRRFKL